MLSSLKKLSFEDTYCDLTIIIKDLVCILKFQILNLKIYFVNLIHKTKTVQNFMVCIYLLDG